MSRIHREHPEATPEEIEALEIAAWMRTTVTSGTPKEERVCRDCGSEFSCNPERGHTKWGSLCSFCLAHEL